MLIGFGAAVLTKDKVEETLGELVEKGKDVSERRERNGQKDL